MNSIEEVTIRRARAEEAVTIAAHRLAMFRDMGSADEAILNDMAARFIPWVTEKIASEEYLEWFAVTEDDAVVAGAGLWLMEWPPHFLDRAARRGYLLNVYTDPGFRRRGLARLLVETAMKWCRAHGIEVMVLHASDAGRPIYEEIGFVSTNEMRMTL
jgi:GNAT superfamily N-acetyltransferase